MDSLLNQLNVPPLFFCPYARFDNKEDEFRAVQFGELPILVPSFSDYQHNKSSSSSSTHPRPLDLCNNSTKDGECDNLICEVCVKPLGDTSFYSCKGCPYAHTDLKFYHRKCIEPISKHPYHPKHSLRYLKYSLSDLVLKCLCCSVIKFKVYRCSICDFIISRDWVGKPPLLAIDHPKRHGHTLLYNPRKGSTICDVCGLSDYVSLMYSCLPCDLVFHKECIYFPRIMKISRHKHRLSFISSLTPEKWSCGVCRKNIDTNYGRYSCMEGCNYGVHSNCATRRDVWDGKELEGTTEDAYEEEIKSFYEISDGIIKYFSHQNHHMRLDVETNREFDENKCCQACTRPIPDAIIYNCMQCDYILHQECAHLPRKKQHVMHPHPLNLEVHYVNGWFKCTACGLKSNGFMYTCKEENRRYNCNIKLDVCCASMSEPFEYQYHPHPLFLTSETDSEQTCSICQLRGMCLNCGECGFVLCYRCATLPNKLRYKHDEHMLILFYDEKSSGQYCCDVCESKVDPKNGIYMCNYCNVAFHINCLLGEDMNMLPGKKINFFFGKIVHVLSNNHLTRNICDRCGNRCQAKLVYKTSDRKVCSISCVVDQKLFFLY